MPLAQSLSNHQASNLYSVSTAAHILLMIHPSYPRQQTMLLCIAKMQSVLYTCRHFHAVKPLEELSIPVVANLSSPVWQSIIAII